MKKIEREKWNVVIPFETEKDAKEVLKEINKKLLYGGWVEKQKYIKEKKKMTTLKQCLKESTKRLSRGTYSLDLLLYPIQWDIIQKGVKKWLQQKITEIELEHKNIPSICSH